jgi:hypothetical protein
MYCVLIELVSFNASGVVLRPFKAPFLNIDLIPETVNLIEFLFAVTSFEDEFPFIHGQIPGLMPIREKKGSLHEAVQKT